MANEARTRISLDGAPAVVNGLERIRQKSNELNKSLIDQGKDVKSLEQLYGSTAKIAEQGFGKLGGVGKELLNVGKAVLQIGSNFARASNDLRGIDFGQAADKFRVLDESLTRISVRGGKNLNELRDKFQKFGDKSGLGTQKFGEATLALDKRTFAGTDESAESVKQLGMYADDTGQSIEEVLGLGEQMYTKLGIPAKQVGLELAKVRDIARDSNLAGGFLGLENTLSRLSRFTPKLEGGRTRVGGMAALLQAQGYSKDVADEGLERVLGAIDSLPDYTKRAVAQRARGSKFEPFTVDPRTGRQMLSEQGQQAIFEYGRGKSINVLTNMFGGDEGTARLFQKLASPEFQQRLQANREFVDREAVDRRALGESLARRGFKTQAGSYFNDYGAEGAVSEFSKTAAGKRDQVDREKRAVEMQVGENVQLRRDAVNKMFEGKRGQQAALGTLLENLPASGITSTAVNVGVAAVADNNMRVQEKKDARESGGLPRTVTLDQASIKALADRPVFLTPPPTTEGEKIRARQF